MLPILLAIIGSVVILFVLTPTYLCLSSHYKHKRKAFILKIFTTLISFSYALFGYLELSRKNHIQNLAAMIHSPYWVMLGLGLFVLANILLYLHMIAGGLLLLLGHLAYIIFFITLGGFHAVAIVVYTMLCVATLCYFYRYTPAVKRFLHIFAIYAMCTLVTLALGLLLPFTYGLYGIVPALASLLLISSDFMFARNKLLQETRFTRRIGLSCYFFSQFLMAMTLYIAAYLT